jgi:hypothetical protein
LCVFGVVGIYLCLYGVLSVCGRYERADLGSLHGVEIGYTWAPVGFYDQRKGWRSGLLDTFYPLWYLDTRYVHKSR